MYRILAILFFVLSCNRGQQSKEGREIRKNSRVVKLILPDSLRTIVLLVPVRYDTGFSWIHYSDCGKPCDLRKYRFQPASFPIQKESGFLWSEKRSDSIDRLTISHTNYFPFHNGDTSKDLIRHTHLKEEITLKTPGRFIVFDTIEKISDRYYSIIATENSDRFKFRSVLAVTTIKGNEVRFEYQYSSKKEDSIGKNFVKNSIGLLRSIKISNGP